MASAGKMSSTPVCAEYEFSALLKSPLGILNVSEKAAVAEMHTHPALRSIALKICKFIVPPTEERQRQHRNVRYPTIKISLL